MLDAAGLDGLDEEGEPDSSRDCSGYRLAGHGDKVEVRYEAADELLAPSYEDAAGQPDRPEHQRLPFRRRIETVMLSAIAEILMAAGNLLSAALRSTAGSSRDTEKTSHESLTAS
ncbi:hypothetical protein GCM10022226_79110 [Sphaerisporangium flaviroseum]|uniref:Transposase n=1 Tax=Sphaerisporangium flaviroseum TaxID=509199 RepID=A0ABP7JHF0_9ACTN